MRRKILVLCNANAGTGNVSRNLFEIVRLLAENGCETTIYPIIPASGLTSEAIIRERGRDFEAVIVCGGDGTMNHVINVLAKENLDIPLSYLPSGSANDFAKTLYRRDRVSVRDVCRYFLSGRTKLYDIGRLNEDYFNYVACFGAFTKVSYTTPRDLKNTLGFGAYVINMLATIPEDISYVRHVRFIHDGIEEEGDYLAGYVSNSISVAGMKSHLIEGSEIDDGWFELTMIRHPENPLDAAEMGSELIGSSNEDKFVCHWRVKHLEMQFDEDTPWTMDGESGRDYRSVTINVVPKKIRIFTDQ